MPENAPESDIETGPEAAERAEARGRGYVLLADLIARGPTEALEAPARASELLAEALDGYPERDEAEADHQHVFGFVVHPFEGAFLDPRGEVGSTRGAALHARYEAFGYRPPAKGEDPEHLATELRALGVLSGAEADAAADGKADIVGHLRELQRGFLDEHVLRWFGALASAARRSGRAWPTALLAQLEDLLALHRGELGGAVEAPPLEGKPLALDDPETDLRGIARFLTTPARAGLFLGKDDLARVGRALELPRGFGSRALMTQNLLRSAVRFGRLGEVTAALGAILAAWEEEIDASPFAAQLAPWRQRGATTKGALEELGAAVARFAEEAEEADEEPPSGERGA